MHHDEQGAYFKPVDFSAGVKTHLNVDALCSMLEDYPDRELVHMLRDGFVYVKNPDLDMVINPHLLSLAHGPQRVHDQLIEMGAAPQNYVRFVSKLQQHYAHVSEERILLAFGRLPCVCAAQGTREKKLDVGADIRRIEDATAPHRTLEGDDHVVRSVNDMMTLLDDDGRPLAPKERKPDNGYLMRGNAKLQSAAATNLQVTFNRHVGPAPSQFGYARDNY